MKKQTYKKIFNVALTTTLATGAVVAVAPTQSEAALNFKDVKETNTHYANILNLTERGIIKGYEDGTFRPGDSIKRGNAAHIIAEIIGLDTKNVKNPNFKDISTKNSNYGAIAALANAGIINGFEDGTYRANENLTRGQMAKIIDNAFKLAKSDVALPFTDIQNSQYKEHIAALFANNVTTGVTPTKFDAKSNVTRGQLASFVVRAENASVSAVEGEYTIGSVVGNTVTIAGEEFEVTPELAAVFNSENAAALKNSVVTIAIEYSPEKVASTTPMFAKNTGKIIGIKSVKLVNYNTSFNPKGFKISNIEVAAKSVSLSNVKADNLEVATGGSATITGSEIAELVLATNAVVTLNKTAIESLEIKGSGKITLGEGTTLKTVVLEKGKTLADVITNYNAVKDLLKDVKVEVTDGTGTTPTPPVGGGIIGGDNETPATPLTPEQKNNYIKNLNDKLKAIDVEGIEVVTNGTSVTITSSPSITKAELESVSAGVIDSFMGIGTTAVLKSVTINNKDYSQNSSLADLKGIAKDLAFAINIPVDKAEAIKNQPGSESIWEELDRPSYSGTITLNFKDNDSTAVRITLIKGQ